jgi:very-short-patch-repair endonuclease
MKFEDITEDWLRQQYQTKSCKTIAEEVGSYPMAIHRLLRKWNITTSEYRIQDKHPRVGSKHNLKTKIQISRTKLMSWIMTSDEVKKKFREMGLKAWNDKTPEEKERTAQIFKKSNPEVVKHGSFLERYIRDRLLENRYQLLFHQKHIFYKTQMEVDILLPSLRTIIEIDGPLHYLPIYGQEILAKIHEKDMVKNDLFLSLGYFVIRIKYTKKMVKLFRKEAIWQKLDDVLRKIKGNTFEKHEHLIYLEVP